MIASRTKFDLLPPRLSMDEYADFIEASIKAADPAHAAQQKALEERIVTPFRISGENLSPVLNATTAETAL